MKNLVAQVSNLCLNSRGRLFHILQELFRTG